MRWFDFCRMAAATWLLSLPLDSIGASEPSPVETVAPRASVKLRPGEFKLLRADRPVVRVATSNAEVCSAVNYDGRTLAVWGRGSGTSDVMVWLADGSYSPVVWVVEVK
jgi:Flp pilus assembly secretin CpaC